MLLEPGQLRSAQLGWAYAYFVARASGAPTSAHAWATGAEPLATVAGRLKGMAGRPSQLLHTRMAAHKRDWLRRLRARPPVSALAHVDILVYRVDDTLRQLRGLLDGHPDRLAMQLSGHSGWRDGCQCGLNPLMDFYLTGAAALDAILVGLDEEERATVGRAWHVLAQRELENLCGACCRRTTDCAIHAGEAQLASGCTRAR